MSMTETEPTPPADKTKKPRRKYRRKQPAGKAAPAAAAATPAAPSFLDGMTARECALACGPKGCVITGSICAHPLKGGLQGAFQNNTATVERYTAARKKLAHAKIEA